MTSRTFGIKLSVARERYNSGYRLESTQRAPATRVSPAELAGRLAALGEGVGGDEADARGVEGGLGAALHAQLGEDAAHVALHRLLADAQRGRDLLIGFALRQQPQHVRLAVGQRLGALRRAHLA